MSTLVAVHREGKRCVVADSLTTYGGRRKETSTTFVAHSTKLFLVENMIIGTSGDAAWNPVIRNFLSNQKNVDITDPKELIDSLFELWTRHKDTYFISATCQTTFSTTLFPQILVSAPCGIFEVTPEGSVIDKQQMAVIGGGIPFACGAIQALSQYTNDPYKLAIAGIKAAGAWDPNTTGPFIGWYFTNQKTLEKVFSK